MMNWSELPDLCAIGLLTCAFASVARRYRTSVSGLWLTGWVMIDLHFAAFLFLTFPGDVSAYAGKVGLVALTCSGVLFQSAVVPYRREISARWMMYLLMVVYAFFLLVRTHPSPNWSLELSAILFGVAPLAVTLFSIRRLNRALRWVTVLLHLSLAVFLLVFQLRSADSFSLSMNAVLFTVFFGCCVNFAFAYWRATAGAFVTIAGFVAWAAVFVVSPFMGTYYPNAHVESEVWNLPKFVVAVGMILLLLEDQIEHNKHLALHDELTGLPNRRLFLDRLENALDRASRTGTQMALLVVDLNRFKQVNDTLGHHVGDLLLHRVGVIFTSRMRRSDTVARTGGDEFSIILEEPTSRVEAALVVSDLMQLLEEPQELEGLKVQTGASIGVAIFPEDATDLESLCIAADVKMYAEKKIYSEQLEQAAKV